MDKKIAIFFLCGVFAIFVIPSAIFAASFDCSEAKTETEKAICGDLILSKLDDDMAAAYSKALETSDRDAVKKEQRKWLKDTLYPCRGDKECIQKAYEDRLDQLSQSADSLKDAPHPAPARPLSVPLRLASSADQADTFYGTYQGFSRACQASFIVLDKDKVSIFDCKEAPYTTIESDSEHILIEVKPSATCTSQIIKIEREKELKFGGFTVKIYDNRKKALEDHYNLYCSYGQVDPSMAKDQTKNFLGGKTGEERRDALRKINGQIHPERDKYNEIGLRDESSLVRDTAAWFLRGEPSHFVPMLINVMANDPDAKVRASAGYSLSRFYTDNGSEGYLYIEPLEDNLDKLLIGLKRVETVRSVVDILGNRCTGNSFVPCLMSTKNRKKVLEALRNQLKAIRLQADEWNKGRASWSNELNEADNEINVAINNLAMVCPIMR